MCFEKKSIKMKMVLDLSQEEKGVPHEQQLRTTKGKQCVSMWA